LGIPDEPTLGKGSTRGWSGIARGKRGKAKMWALSTVGTTVTATVKTVTKNISNKTVTTPLLTSATSSPVMGFNTT